MGPGVLRWDRQRCSGVVVAFPEVWCLTWRGFHHLKITCARWTFAHLFGSEGGDSHSHAYPTNFSTLLCCYVGGQGPRKKSRNALNPVTTEGVLRREDGSGSQYAATISQRKLRQGGPSYQASALLRLDAVMCCVAV